jgi:general secretion pathway protein M
MKATWDAFWAERTPREKILLAVAGACVLVLLVYQVLWEPAASGRARLQSDLPRMDAQLARMHAQAQQARGYKNADAAPPAATGLDALRASLAEQGLSNAQLSGNGSVLQLRVASAPFDRCVAWLDLARRTYKLQVVDAEVNALPQAGMVALNVTLQGNTP